MERYGFMESYPRFRIGEEIEAQADPLSSEDESDIGSSPEHLETPDNETVDLKGRLITPEGSSSNDPNVPNIEKRLLALTSPPEGIFLRRAWKIIIYLESSRSEFSTDIKGHEVVSVEARSGERRDRATILSEAILLRTLRKLLLPLLRLALTQEYRNKLEEYTKLLQLKNSLKS